MRQFLELLQERAQATSAFGRAKVVSQNSDGSWLVDKGNGQINIPAGDYAEGQWIELRRNPGGGWVGSQSSGYPGGL